MKRVSLLAVILTLGLLPSTTHSQGQTHDIFFISMTINSCNEFGTCDWKLKCTVSDQQSQELIINKPGDTGASLDLGQSITSTRDFPLTVSCAVHEHDGGFGAQWESVGNPSIKVYGVGEYTLNAANDEGDVTIHFTIDSVGVSQQGLTAAARSPAKYYSGVFRSGYDGHVLWLGAAWPDFVAKWTEFSDQGLRLIDLETYEEGGKRLYAGVFRAGSDGHFLWNGVEWPAFVTKWEQLSSKGLRLIDLETYREGGKRLYAGVFRAGSDGHFLWNGVEWPAFVQKWKELSKQNLRLVDIETYVEGTKRLYAGVFRTGTDKHYLWAGVEWPNFEAKWRELSDKGLRLIDLETYEEGGKRLYIGVFREGSEGYYLWVNMPARDFIEKWKEMSRKGMRLVDLEIFPE